MCVDDIRLVREISVQASEAVGLMVQDHWNNQITGSPCPDEPACSGDAAGQVLGTPGIAR